MKGGDQHFEDLCQEKARRGDGAFAIAFALIQLADAQQQTAAAIRRLGLGDASTPFGAIEALVMQMRETGGTLAAAIQEKAE